VLLLYPVHHNSTPACCFYADPIRHSRSSTAANRSNSGTDREFSANFDHQASGTLSFSFPCLFLPDARKTVFNLCLVPPKGYARMEPVPRFDRARNSDAKFSTVVLG
jgi:hypothetical protein